MKNIGHIIIDGFGIGDISSEVIKERENLGRDGVIALSTLIDYKKKTPIGELQINSYGAITKDNKDIVYNIINDLFKKQFEGKSPKEINLKEIQEHLRKTIKRKIYRIIDKEPLIVITLYEIQELKMAKNPNIITNSDDSVEFKIRDHNKIRLTKEKQYFV